MDKFKLLLFLILCLILHPSEEINSVYYWKNLIQTIHSMPELKKEILETQLATLREISIDSLKKTEDVYLNISQLIRKYGYEFEEHNVPTNDGYIVTLHRIPGKGHPVLLYHGILQSSDDFVTAGPNSALAYYLASIGFDVWLGNARGNKHSKKHVRLTSKDPKFWDFSWHEIGKYDLPAAMDYVLKITGRKKLHYVGFSQGNTSFYVLCSELPEYCEKVTLLIALSPVASMSHAFSPFMRFLFAIDLFSNMIKEGQLEFMPKESLTDLCTADPLLYFLCNNFLFLCFGFDRGQFNITNLPVFLNHAPSGCSAKQFEHYKQSLYSGKFRKFDYGERTNMATYGTKIPPYYKLDKVTVPVALFYSNSDYFSGILDVYKLRKSLPNVVGFYEVKNFNHLDYQFGRDVKEKVYVRVVELLNKYS